ncbi:hypothetical protein AF331_16635 [Rossellomorea marisflavi]|uniref:Uncharacterized protein n=1 Tax=Rossellomorea marisflavi TaxID=189381 RepID=A0A0M0G1Y1_9BACI|nr:AAA family ATPase [Rossellomorea marisflavi]KON83788.1 hypothetical protein AF331_16635 [Rossellomorea marisflavi]
MQDTDYLEDIINLFHSTKESYGTLKKCEFHFHSPASHDYELIPNNRYTDLKIEEILDFAVRQSYLTKDNSEKIIEDIEHYQGEAYFHELKSSKKPFASFKEYISYMLLAHKLYQKQIEVAILTDHNTINGFKKLKYALEEYYKERIKGWDSQRPIYLFLGVEISCSEQNHLIGIFNENDYEKVQQFLLDVVISEEEGTYLTSEQLIKDITKDLDGLAYIAHLNSSNLYGSGLYNKTLFSSNLMKVFGLTNLSTEKSQRGRIKNFNKAASKNLGIIYEGDSHSIETIGVKNTWIKFNKIDFPALKKAFHNHSINIYTEKPQKSDTFIKGMLVFPGEKGFLMNKPSYPSNEPFCIDFSRDLNCIIGGRGSGKSTILNILEAALTLEIQGMKNLEFISQHEKIYIMFFHKQSDYILEFIPQKRDLSREYYVENILLPNSYIEKSKEKYLLTKDWVNLFKVSEDSYTTLTHGDVERILGNIYRRSYSINNIINLIRQGNVDEFIKEIILHGLDGDSFSNYTDQIKNTKDRSFNKFLRENIDKIIDSATERKERINKIINGFNLRYSELLKVEYSPKIKNTDYYLLDLLNLISSEAHVEKTYLTWNDVARYIQSFSQKHGFLLFIKLLLQKKFGKLDDIMPISFYVDTTDLQFSDIESNYEIINEENKMRIFQTIFNKITIERKTIETSINKWLEVIDEFTLMFNVNSKEITSNKSSYMKEISEMSLGQQVVAVLSFLFNFGHYANDNTPLVIDQPEDNLDNQYIYKNLVESLKKIKNNRQVIVVTHNSTIVTNSDTEQVIVLESNNENGWIANKGYPSDRKIAKLIINCLEGGIESFTHKMHTYSLFVDELKG